jgi:fluoride exporter
MVWLGVALLGGAGAIARYLVESSVERRNGRTDFPLGHFAVNVSGSLLLGLAVGASLDGDAFKLVGTALLGSYTTFSTWMLDSYRLRPALGVLNVALSLAAGLAAAAIGRAL